MEEQGKIIDNILTELGYEKFKGYNVYFNEYVYIIINDNYTSFNVHTPKGIKYFDNLSEALKVANYYKEGE